MLFFFVSSDAIIGWDISTTIIFDSMYCVYFRYWCGTQRLVNLPSKQRKNCQVHQIRMLRFKIYWCIPIDWWCVDMFVVVGRRVCGRTHERYRHLEVPSSTPPSGRVNESTQVLNRRFLEFMWSLDKDASIGQHLYNITQLWENIAWCLGEYIMYTNKSCWNHATSVKHSPSIMVRYHHTINILSFLSAIKWSKFHLSRIIISTIILFVHVNYALVSNVGR